MTTRDLLRTVKRLRVERDVTFRDLSVQTGIAVSRLVILLDDPEVAKLHARTKHKLEQWVEALPSSERQDRLDNLVARVNATLAGTPPAATHRKCARCARFVHVNADGQLRKHPCVHGEACIERKGKTACVRCRAARPDVVATL